MPHTCLLWTLRSIARIERRGGTRPPRLTEPGFERWERIRRKLGWKDFAALLHEDLADAFPLPFDLRGWADDPFATLSDDEAQRLIEVAAVPDSLDAAGFLKAAAAGLKLPSTGAILDLPRALPHQKVLELGFGRIAAAQVLSQPGLAFHDQFAFVADTQEERVMIGLCAVEAQANPPQVFTTAALRALVAKGGRFDRVLGLLSPQQERLTAELGLEARWAK